MDRVRGPLDIKGVSEETRTEGRPRVAWKIVSRQINHHKNSVSRSLQSSIFRLIASRCPENAIKDHDEVYDAASLVVTHHTSNILLSLLSLLAGVAGVRRETEPVGDSSRRPLTSFYIHRKFNQQTCPQTRCSLNYRQFNSLDISIVRVPYSTIFR